MSNEKNAIHHIGITGAEGHIGTTLREGLPDSYTLKAFTLTKQAFPSTVVDLSEAAAVEGCFEGLDAVIHLAADPSPAAAWDSVLKNNITATYNVFEEARRAGVKKIVFASTNHVQHGETMKTSYSDLDPAKRIMLRLSDPPAPDSLYGVSKLFGEDLGRYYVRFFGLHFVGLRIGATKAEDTPLIARGTHREDYYRAMFLSKRDCVQAFTRALEVETDFMLAYVVGNNTDRVFDLRETKAQLGFYPQDNAATYFEDGI